MPPEHTYLKLHIPVIIEHPAQYGEKQKETTAILMEVWKVLFASDSGNSALLPFIDMQDKSAPPPS